MKKRIIAAQKIFSLLTSLNLVFQSVLGGLLFAPNFSFAQEATPAPIEETVVAETPVTQAPSEPTVEPTPSYSSGQAAEPTIDPALQPTPTPTIEPVSEPTPTLDLTIQEPTPSVSPEPTTVPTITPEATPVPVVEGVNTESTNTPPPNETGPPAPSSNDTPSAIPSENTPTPTVTVEQPTENGQLNAVVLKNVEADSIELDLVSADIEGSATLVTDKADYAPTDTVLITGSGFSPNTEYTLVISSTDEPAVNFETKITTNENGGLVYAYQLDGTYRPNYKVEVRDSTGTVVATVTFTDSSPEIKYNNFEGEIAPQNSNNWTNGNISGYKEGDTIRFRVELDSDAGSLNGHLFIGFTSKTSCRFFKFQDPTNVAIDFNRVTDAIDAGSGFTATFTPPLTQNGDDAVADFALTSSAAKQVRLNFTLQVDENAAACANGSSQHVQIDHVSGDIKSSGNKALPIPASAVAPVTDITVSKTGTANASIGGAVSYTVTVNNLDTTPASSVVVTDTLPAGITGTTATYDVDPNSAGGTGNCTLVSQVFTCNIGTLGGNDGNTTGAEPDVAVITVNGTVNNNTQLCSTSLTNNVSVSTTTLESNTQNNSAQTSTNINACAAHLIVIKHVINNNGGAASASDFTMTINGVTASGGNSFAGAESPGTDKTLTTVGSYNITEGGPSGYNQSASSDCSGTIALGQTKSCTITNDDQAATLIVKKTLINDNGGTKTKADFSFKVNGGGSQAFEADGQNDLTVNAGIYSVVEDVASGYSTTYDNCSGVVIPNGGSATCTITNDDIPAHLIVIKHVDNTNGGTATSSDFTMTINGITAEGGNSFPGTESPGTDKIVLPGTYNVTESGPDSYQSSFSTDCTGSIALGQTKTCTVTNDDKPATLIVKKHVVNDNGGNAVAGNFTMNVTGTNVSDDSFPGSEAGTSITLDAGTFSVDENSFASYAKSIGANCSGTIAIGQTKTCTITNDDIAPQLTVIKHVINDSDGTLSADDFTMNVAGTNVSDPSFTGAENPGTTVTLDAGSYNVTETGGDNTYTSSTSADCSGTITIGESKTCTITNEDVDFKPTIEVTKTANPISVPETGGNVNFTFTVKNLSTFEPVTITSLSDNVFGALDGDADCQVGTLLAVGATCDFAIIRFISGDYPDNHVNVFTAHAEDNEKNDASDTDDETVTFDDVLPDISVTKDADPTTVPETGGNITFTYVVYNNSNESAEITVLSDNQFGTLTGDADCQVGTVLASNSSCSFSQTFAVPAGDASGTHVNIFTTTVTDDDDNNDTASDDATVTYIGANITLDPLSATNNINDFHLLTATVTENSGTGPVAAADEMVTFSLVNNTAGASFVGGINTCTTNASGQCSIQINSASPGSVDIHGSVDVGLLSYTLHRETDGTLGSSGNAAKTYVAGKIIIEKQTLPDGDQTAFTFTGDVAGAIGDGGKIEKIVIPGTYSVAEAVPAGWDFTNIVCSDNNSGQSVTGGALATINVESNETVTCTFTNTKQPKLTVTKIVTNDNGGAKVIADFPLFVDGNPVTSGIKNIFSAGAHTISETGDPGYTETIGGNCASDGTISLSPGDDLTCTITNNDNAPSLTLDKIVANDNGGTALESAWTLTADGGNAGILSGPGAAGATDVVSDTSFKAGTYTLSESTGPAGYTASSWSCVKNGIPVALTSPSLTLGLGDIATCTITNDDIVGQIKIIKNTIGGDGTFDFTVAGPTGQTPSITTSGGTGDTEFLNVDAGVYSISETVPAGWDLTGSSCTSGTPSSFTVSNGGRVDCTFTNTKFGSIQGKKFGDNNNNGVRNGSEPYLNNWQINLYDDEWSFVKGMQTGDDFTEAGNVATGQYLFINLKPENYYVCEELETGWVQTEPTSGPQNPDDNTYCHQVTVNPGDRVESILFGNFDLGEIQGRKFNDLNGNGQEDSGEPVINGWTIRLYNSDWQTAAPEQTTHFIVDYGQGRYRFENLNLGTYYICEVLQDGWTQTDPGGSEGFANQSPNNSEEAPRCRQAIIDESGDFISGKLFGNVNYGSISGMKYEDRNGNGEQNEGDNGLEEWTIELKQGETVIGSTTTAIDGTYSFQDIIAGDYQVCEVEQGGWTRTQPSDSECQPVTVVAGEDTSDVDFGNFLNGRIIACKYNDYAGNGQYESQDDQPLSNISFKLYQDVTLIDTKQTELDGCVTFEDLTAGEYRIEEDYTDPDLNGYYSTDGTTAYENIVVTSGYDSQEEPFVFLNTPYRTISGQKYEDINGDGTKDAGEPGIEGWKIFIDYNDDGLLGGSEPWVETDNNGYYEFTGLVSGSYTVAEVQQTGWTQTKPVSGNYSVDVHTIVISENNDFGNFKLGRIQGYKYSDENDNGSWNQGEKGIEGWEICLGKVCIKTNADGYYEFTGLAWGDYEISEEHQTGWTQTEPKDPETYKVLVSSGTGLVEGRDYNFGNAAPIKLTLEKSNDKPVAHTGDIVTYTLNIGVSGRALSSMTLIDNSPDGFVYQTGTATVVGGTVNNTEPTLTNSGKTLTWTWTAVPGSSTVTVTYQTKIDSGNQAASYTNYAYVYGSGSPTSTDSEIVDSVVRIDPDISPSAQAGGEVLGAATELPASGSNTWYLIFALSLIGAGFVIKKFSRKIN